MNSRKGIVLIHSNECDNFSKLDRTVLTKIYPSDICNPMYNRKMFLLMGCSGVSKFDACNLLEETGLFKEVAYARRVRRLTTSPIIAATVQIPNLQQLRPRN